MLIEKSFSNLLIIDVQEKLVSVMPKPHTFIDNIIKLQKASNILKIPIIISEQYPNGLGQTILKIKNQMEKTQTNYQLVVKTHFAVLSKSDPLIKKSSGSQFIICGIESHVCVLQTAVRLSENKKNTVYVVQDAVSSRYEKDYLMALSRLNKYPNIEIVSCEMVLFEWLRKSGTKEFKAISQLIK